MVGAMLVRHEPTGPATVRRELAADLDDRGVPAEFVHAATLVASELLGNAVRHGRIAHGDAVDVFWTIGTRDVVVTVCDASTATPQVRMVSVEEPGGRGMAIVDALTTEWGTARTATGKCVWAKIPLR